MRRAGSAASGPSGSGLQVRFARFGALAGMISQLTNDLAALRPDAVAKTDIALGKPTVPLTFAAQLARDGTPAVEGVPRHDWQHGPIQLTWVIAATYRSHALAIIPDLTSDPACRDALVALVALR